MYVAALRSMIESKEEEPGSTATLKFKSSDLIHFVLERAKIEPLALCVLG